MSTERVIYLTKQDLLRLESLIQTLANAGGNQDALDNLEAELQRAELVDQDKMPPNVVTMNSRVRFVDESTGEKREVTLVYPQDADPRTHKVSVVAPVGTALLGLAAGQTIDWPLPTGKIRRLKIVEVLYQPEASGDLHL